MQGPVLPTAGCLRKSEVHLMHCSMHSRVRHTLHSASQRMEFVPADRLPYACFEVCKASTFKHLQEW